MSSKMRWPRVAVFAGVLAVAGYFAFDYFAPGAFVATSIFLPQGEPAAEETLADRIAKARERSGGVKGVYMSAEVANDRGRAATKLRGDIVSLLETTELDAVVIDVKETRGGAIITDELGEFIQVLHGMGVWAIARQVVFKDSSQEKTHPAWYLTYKSGSIWRDRRGGSWLDPASSEVWDYQLAVAHAASDAGFDEIQFDYIRFPSDGNLSAITYPVYDGTRPRHEIMREFFEFLRDGLKRYRPELILSADLFGYVAIQGSDLGIGQRLADIGENFDYISLMVYPSHYYSGFEVPADPVRNLPAVFLPYRSQDRDQVAANQPYVVVHRSLLIAADALAGKIATTSSGQFVATSTVAQSPPSSRAKLRPWLQDFDLAVDSSRGIRYDAAKVRAEIDAAEDAGSSGWLLWNAANVYTRAALQLE